MFSQQMTTGDDDPVKPAGDWQQFGPSWAKVLPETFFTDEWESHLNFYTLECGAGGHCLFSSVAEALRKNGQQCSVASLRQICADDILQSPNTEEAREMRLAQDLPASRRELAAEIVNGRDGGWYAIPPLSQQLRVNFVIFQDTDTAPRSAYLSSENHERFLLLYYISKGSFQHWRLVGFCDTRLGDPAKSNNKPQALLGRLPAILRSYLKRS